jgi:putative ABC-type transport system, ATPase component
MLEIQIDQISYRKKSILSDIFLKVEGPGLYGFFGKNGAGKTTFFKAVCKLLSFKGRILYNNKNIESSDIAFIPTEPFIYEYLTIEEFQKFYQNIIKGKYGKEKIFDLEAYKLLKECSTGTKKKAYINAVLQRYDYTIYIFDEPFNGLDIESNYIILNKILEISKHSIVFISSHIVEVIEEYLDDKFLIHEGKIIKFDKQKPIKSYFWNDKNII